MKKTLLISILTLISIVVFAQTPVTPMTADFKYNDQTIQKAMTDNKLEFALQNISNTLQLDHFAETAQQYKNDLTVALIPTKSNVEKTCLVTFVNNKVSMGTLLRLFVSNSISEVVFDGKKMTTMDFFAKYNSR